MLLPGGNSTVYVVNKGCHPVVMLWQRTLLILTLTLDLRVYHVEKWYSFSVCTVISYWTFRLLAPSWFCSPPGDGFNIYSNVVLGTPVMLQLNREPTSELTGCVPLRWNVTSFLWLQLFSCQRYLRRPDQWGGGWLSVAAGLVLVFQMTVRLGGTKWQ